MAINTLNVSGVRALRFIMTSNDTYYFTNAVDQQLLTLTLQQDGTGSRTVTSGNCTGIMQPGTTANADTTQTLQYDAATNNWNGVPGQLAPGSMVRSSTTTNTSISWQRGMYSISGGGAATLTITNPTAGVQGTGNDGEIMWINITSAQTHKITMTTTQSVNGSSTSIQFAGAIGNAVGLMAFGGNVYILASEGALTLS